MRHKILIVDDDANVRFVISEALSGEHEVLTAAEGRSAVEIIKKERPALIFLDMRMPGISGLEVLQMVKESGVTAVIWMLTGEEDVDTALKTLKLGAVGYLTKPFEIAKIRDIVSNAIADNEHENDSDARGEKPWRVKKSK